MSNLMPIPNKTGSLITEEAFVRMMEPHIKQGYITDQQVRAMWQKLYAAAVA